MSYVCVCGQLFVGAEVEADGMSVKDIRNLRPHDCIPDTRKAALWCPQCPTRILVQSETWSLSTQARTCPRCGAGMNIASPGDFLWDGLTDFYAMTELATARLGGKHFRALEKRDPPKTKRVIVLKKAFAQSFPARLDEIYTTEVCGVENCLRSPGHEGDHEPHK